MKAGISAVHLGDQETAERHFAVLRDLGVEANGDLYLSVADTMMQLGRPQDALPYLQVSAPLWTRTLAYVNGHMTLEPWIRIP